MNFVQAVKAYFTKWNDFRSRSSRSEYWWATLFVTFAPFPLVLVAGFISAIFSLGFSPETVEIIRAILILIMYVFIIIAGTCLVIRRFHDLDKSGWWYLLVFTIVGIIPVIYWLCCKGTDESNRFGDDPL